MARPLCDGRSFASSPFHRLASRGPCFRGFPLWWAMGHAICDLLPDIMRLSTLAQGRSPVWVWPTARWLGQCTSVWGASRLGSSLSVAEEVSLGSSPQLRSLRHLSAFVLCRHSRIPKGRFWCVALLTFRWRCIDASVAVLSVSTTDYSLACQSFARWVVSIGAELRHVRPTRGFQKYGTRGRVFVSLHLCSVWRFSLCAQLCEVLRCLQFGGMKFGSSLYLIDMLILASSLSLRSFARLGASVAVLSDTHLSLSLRSFSRLGSSLSVWSIPRFGSHLGSSLSLRSLRNLVPRCLRCVKAWILVVRDGFFHFWGSLFRGALPTWSGHQCARIFAGPSKERRWRFSRLSVLLCPCEVYHVWGRRFLWWKKCLSARLFHCVWALLCLCCHSRISERRFRCVALPTWLVGGTAWIDKIGFFVFGVRLHLAKHSSLQGGGPHWVVSVVAIIRPCWCVSRGSQRFDDRFLLGSSKLRPLWVVSIGYSRHV